MIVFKVEVAVIILLITMPAVEVVVVPVVATQ